MSDHLRLVWSQRIAAEFTPHGWEVGDRVVVNDSRIGQPVSGTITATIMQTPNVYVRFDGIEETAMVSVDMLEAEAE